MRKGLKIAIGVILVIAILVCAYFLYQSILGDSNKSAEPSQDVYKRQIVGIPGPNAYLG